MTAYLLEWAGLLVRWIHIVTGIAWIGASFYFVWLDNHLQAPDANTGAAVDPLVGGELWAVHGGGFYRSQKYRLSPAVLPRSLHWFYWEAYSTWLSGFALLCLVYFYRAEGYLIDPAVAALTKPAAILICLAWLAASWLIYDLLCRSALERRPRLLGGVLCMLVAAQAWGLCRLFSGRGAFLMFGASLGTIMVANVFFVIIPGQRELVRAKAEGRALDPAPGLRGKQRSIHNTYFTLPVLFSMISNHYAMTFGARHDWLVLIAMSAAGASLRAWFVARHKPAQRGRLSWIPAALGVLILAAVVAALAPLSNPADGVVAVSDPARVQRIVAQRCTPCHALTPTQPGFAAAPNGLVFETPAELQAHLPEVRQQLALRAMPLGNLTGMTEEERATVLAWAAPAAADARGVR